MSIFDDIGKAFEDLYHYMVDGAENIFNTLTDVIYRVTDGHPPRRKPILSIVFIKISRGE
ncbi:MULTISPECIES: hypothetical protein [unclassified Mucilaginibacter]|uniref:hypothetical protein n=1 Tax=unclassified Mucilaginibacter TaxID=2617802 RepID=UPI002AC9D6C3|nr:MULTISPECIES: hypothetical protein [unclassified Mucilaginibacter]MEB0279558.1 hypothetical protein [Mucilaginibacter sp. 10B2]MEB0302041.1 hypothetical protein [Mucilaginibacter sp. 5C4]WPX22574.1 hypothetical protein RHM67_14935 [Mucilaginibacter sp. 5C4]